MESYTVTIILLILTWIFYKLFTRKPQLGRTMPGPKGYPLVGSALELTLDNIYGKFSEFAEQFGDVFQIQILGTQHVVLNSVDMVQKMFCGEQYKAFFNNKPSFFFGDYFYEKGQTITFCVSPKDREHSEMRKSLTKSLHVYGDGIPEFEERVKTEVIRLVETIDDFKGRDFDMVAVIRESLSNLISILLIGKPAEKADTDAFWDLVWNQDFFLGAITDNILLTFPFLVRVPGMYKRKFDHAQVSKQRIMDRYFRHMKATRKPGVTRGIVDWYLERQEEELDQGTELFMTDKRIMNHIIEVMIAGIVTTMSVLSGVMLCVVNHPEYQDKLNDEVTSVTEEPTLADRHKCPLTEAVLLEGQRYLTPAPFLGPHVCAKDMNFEGFHVAEGTVIYPNVWYIHHSDKVWGDPWEFRPERFLDEHGEILPNTHPYRKSWLPFGIGRRQCPGQTLALSRLFLYVATLSKTFVFVPTDGRCGTCDPRNGEFDKNITFRPKPFYCRAERRKQQ